MSSSSSTRQEPIKELVERMRATALVAGQCSVETLNADEAAIHRTLAICAAEWASELENILRAHLAEVEAVSVSPLEEARLLALAIEYHTRTDGQGEGEYGCNGATCPGVQRLLKLLKQATSRAVSPAQPDISREETTLRELEGLQRGWDGYDGAPPDPRAIEAVRKFLRYAWSVVPCPDGAVQLERHDSDLDIEVSFAPDGSTEDAYAELASASRGL